MDNDALLDVDGALAAAEAERDFCLRSLRDLDDEHAAGDLDDADYAELRDAYVARAASALRTLDGADGPAPPDGPAPATSSPAGVAEAAGRPGRGETPPPGGRRHRVLVTVVAAALVVGGVVWAVVASSSSRSPGAEITGQVLAPQTEAQILQAAGQAVDKGDTVTALKDYQKVLKTDPSQAQALTGEGWILAQTQQPAYLQQGLGLLAQAEKASPSYPPAHLYRGISLLSEDDYADAIPELQWYLAHGPDPSLVGQVRQALTQAQAKVKAAG